MPKPSKFPTRITPRLAAVLQTYADSTEPDLDYQSASNKTTTDRLFNLAYLARGRILVGGGERYHISQLGLQMLHMHRDRQPQKQASRNLQKSPTK